MTQLTNGNGLIIIDMVLNEVVRMVGNTMRIIRVEDTQAYLSGLLQSGWRLV